MLVLSDQREILCICPYRDSDHTKLGVKSQNVMIAVYGARGIGVGQLEEVAEMTLSYIRQVSGRKPSMIRVFSPQDQ